MTFIAAFLAAVVSGYQLSRMVEADSETPSTEEELTAKAYEANEVRRKAELIRLSKEKHDRIGFMLTSKLYRRSDNGKKKNQENRQRNNIYDW